MARCIHCHRPLVAGATAPLHSWCYREVKWGQTSARMVECDESCAHPADALHRVSGYGNPGASSAQTYVLGWRREGD